MQLDALLRSAERYAPDAFGSVTVLAKASSELHARAYDGIGTRPGVWWCWEPGGFEADFRRLLATAGKHVCFLTDDDVFYRPARRIFAVNACYSYRLGLNTVHCHPRDSAQGLPEIKDLGSDFQWDWRIADSELDFAYPLSLDGHVFETGMIRALLDFPFTNPTQLEAGLAARAERIPHRPYMVAARHSSLVSIPANRVSASSGCPCSDDPATHQDVLAERYLAGQMLDLDAMDFSDVRAAHQEIPLWFTERPS
jgi:hypothetical protein